MISLWFPGSLFAKAARIFASVAVSTALVQSSSISTFGFFKQSSCDTQTLLLTTGYVGSALFDVGVVLVRHLLDKFIGAGQLTGRGCTLLWWFLLPQRRFSRMVPGEQHIFLQHHGYLISQRLHIISRTSIPPTRILPLVTSYRRLIRLPDSTLHFRFHR